MTKQEYFFKGFMVIMLVLGLIWARSSYAKITGGVFAQSLGGVLIKTAPANPYPFYKNFLLNVAIPNSELFGNLTVWGEFLVAVAILGGGYLLLKNPANKLFSKALIAGLIGGAFLNLNFWLAFSSTSLSTDSLNLLMFGMEAIGVFVLIKSA